MSRATTGLWIAIAGAVVIAVGSLGPWAKALGQTMAGTEADGVITLVLAALALAVLWVVGSTTKAWPALVALLIGLAVLTTGVIDYIDINDTTELVRDLAEEEDDLLGALRIQANADTLRNPAWGIYLVIAGGVVVAVASAVAWLEKSRLNDLAAFDAAATGKNAVDDLDAGY